MTTRGRVARISSMSFARDGSSFWRWASGSPALSRTCTPSARAARSASAARVAASPRVPVSPWVRSMIPTRCPARTALARVPPQVSSASSRCAAIARTSTVSATGSSLCVLEVGEVGEVRGGSGGCGVYLPQPPPTSPNLQNLPPGYSYRKASTGSSLAALAAGAIPKTSPTAIDTIVAIAARHTHRLAQSDLPRPARHRHHHDRHHPDAADQERDTREHEHHEKERERQTVEDAEHLVRGQQVEAVGLAHPQPAQAPQLQRGGVHGARDAHLGPGLHEDDQAVHPIDREALVRRLERDDARDLRCTRHLEDVGGSLPHPYHAERSAADAYDLPDRVAGPEQPVHGSLLDDRHRGPAAQLRRGKDAARDQAAAQDLHVAIVCAEHTQDLRAVAGVLEAVEHLGPDRRVVDLGQAGDRLGFLGCQGGPDAHFARQCVRIERRRRKEAEDAKGGGPDDLERVDDLLPEARHDRRHGHDRGDPDDDPEDGESRAQLVDPELIERDPPPFANRVEGHATRSAVLRWDRGAPPGAPGRRRTRSPR